MKLNLQDTNTTKRLKRKSLSSSDYWFDHVQSSHRKKLIVKSKKKNDLEKTKWLILKGHDTRTFLFYMYITPPQHTGSTSGLFGLGVLRTPYSCYLESASLANRLLPPFGKPFGKLRGILPIHMVYSLLHSSGALNLNKLTLRGSTVKLVLEK